jgi:hypothetical protein
MSQAQNKQTEAQAKVETLVTSLLVLLKEARKSGDKVKEESIKLCLKPFFGFCGKTNNLKQ